jgi:chorismate synthase
VFTVRAILDPDTIRLCEDLQMRIWGMSEREIVPLHQLVAAISAGGLVLGGFAPDGALVGFAYAVPGWRLGLPVWHSHMTGVLPTHQDSGLGFQLKCAQREGALAAGIAHIVWTYDPLQAGNARFNLGRLGAVASRYHEDYYGAMTDAINRGLPSDRFEVDWFLRSARVISRLAGAPRAPLDLGCPRALAAAGPTSPPAPGRPHLDLDAPRLLVEIPPNLATLKAEHPGLAASWREATRAVFGFYLARGYMATEAAAVPDSDAPRTAYLLERTPDHVATLPSGQREGAPR